MLINDIIDFLIFLFRSHFRERSLQTLRGNLELTILVDVAQSLIYFIEHLISDQLLDVDCSRQKLSYIDCFTTM
jgi:hypothetical protein